jgi:hypothetical protein
MDSDTGPEKTRPSRLVLLAATIVAFATGFVAAATTASPYCWFDDYDDYDYYDCGPLC